MTESIKSLLMKVYELWKRGEENERDVAYNKLQELMKKYGVTLKELEEEKESIRIFFYKTEYEAYIITHVAMFVRGSISIRNSEDKYKGKKFKALWLTEAEYKETQFLVEYYKKEWKKEVDQTLDDLITAFIHKHRLFSEDARNKAEESIEFDMQKALRIQALMSGMQSKTLSRNVKGLIEK